MSVIAELAARQLEAYNASDLDGFLSCYHPKVRVYEGEALSFSGRSAMRDRYRSLFEDWDFGADVPGRLVHGSHCVDDEQWWRIDPKTGERNEGRVLVRYTELEGLIGLVRFLGD